MFKGYDPQEVDAFLDDVAEDYEAVLKEVALLKEQIAVQEERARGVTERERTPAGNAGHDPAPRRGR